MYVCWFIGEEYAPGFAELLDKLVAAKAARIKRIQDLKDKAAEKSGKRPAKRKKTQEEGAHEEGLPSEAEADASSTGGEDEDDEGEWSESSGDDDDAAEPGLDPATVTDWTTVQNGTVLASCPDTIVPTEYMPASCVELLGREVEVPAWVFGLSTRAFRRVKFTGRIFTVDHRRDTPVCGIYFNDDHKYWQLNVNDSRKFCTKN